MSPATGPRPDPLADRLLVVDPGAGVVGIQRIADLPRAMRENDLLVLNDAFTWPASLEARTTRGDRVELRLAAELDEERPPVFRAIALGAGDHTVPTEERGDPPPMQRGDRLVLRGGAALEVVDVDAHEPRWIAVRFDGEREDATATILRLGRPIQYAHVASPLALWDVQTPFAARPMAFEMPSAGRPLVPALLARLRARGVAVATLSHAAGLSSTGRPSLDARLPLPERWQVPEETAQAVHLARARGGRVIAAGTTVVRALEAAGQGAPSGVLQGGAGTTSLRIGPSTDLVVVDGILTGIHEPGTSHFELLRAFAPAATLEGAMKAAEAAGFLLHEFGDSMLILPPRPRVVTAPPSWGTVPPCPRPREPMTSAPPRW
jgi:S-adenosylmethionine:tRNA ribosyltransferase-isomerase